LIKTTDTGETYILLGKIGSKECKDDMLCGTFARSTGGGAVVESMLATDKTVHMHDEHFKWRNTISRVIKNWMELLPEQTAKELNACIYTYWHIGDCGIFAFEPRVVEMKYAEMEEILRNMSKLAHGTTYKEFIAIPLGSLTEALMYWKNWSNDNKYNDRFDVNVKGECIGHLDRFEAAALFQTLLPHNRSYRSRL
jgi:hypothetical protein